MPRTKDNSLYWRFLPHYRSPGAIYHCRFSLNFADLSFQFTEDWMFAIVEDSILSEHKKESLIHAYIIMPDHSHAIVQPLPKENYPSAWCDLTGFYPLERITGRIKGGSSRRIHKQNGSAGSLWQEETYDRIVRGGQDLETTIDYIHNNPVRRNLVSSPELYRWSSLQTIYSGEEKYGGWFDVPFLAERLC